MLLGDKKNALQLYNALNQSAYSDSEMVEIRTLDKGVSLSVRNDAAFVLDSNLSIYEHQSTVCPNMPLRCIIYFSSIIERIIKDYNIYGKSLVRIPTPRFAIFYNGAEEQPEQYDLKLSDAFIHPMEQPELELTCRVYNINHGRNKALLDACPVLKEYMIFIDYVREYHRQQDHDNLELAINLAIDRCIRENVLKDYLMEKRSGGVKVTQLDDTFDRQIELERADARKEGWAEGNAAGMEAGMAAGKAAGTAQQIIEIGHEIGWDDDKILERLKAKLDISEEQARSYIESFFIRDESCDGSGRTVK